MPSSATRTAAPAALTLAAALLSSASVRAADGWLIRLAFESGGDKLGQADFVGGDSESIKAGGEVHLEIGLRRGFGGPEWETDLTLGYKSDSSSADNGEISFSRVTLNAVQYFRHGERVRLGAGATYHLGPELEVDLPTVGGERLRGTGEADDAFGFMLAIDYLATTNVDLGVRFTRIDYDFTTGSRQSVSGDSAGAYLSYRF